jgi:hypothetical protein
MRGSRDLCKLIERAFRKPMMLPMVTGPFSRSIRRWRRPRSSCDHPPSKALPWQRANLEKACASAGVCTAFLIEFERRASMRRQDNQTRHEPLVHVSSPREPRSRCPAQPIPVPGARLVDADLPSRYRAERSQCPALPGKCELCGMAVGSRCELVKRQYGQTDQIPLPWPGPRLPESCLLWCREPVD